MDPTVAVLRDALMMLAAFVLGLGVVIALLPVRCKHQSTCRECFHEDKARQDAVTRRWHDDWHKATNPTPGCSYCEPPEE